MFPLFFPRGSRGDVDARRPILGEAQQSGVHGRHKVVVGLPASVVLGVGGVGVGWVAGGRRGLVVSKGTQKDADCYHLLYSWYGSKKLCFFADPQ